MDKSGNLRFQRLWLKSSREDLKIGAELFKLKHYSACLFFCHLALEKVLKAIFIKVNDRYPLPIHDLNKLAEKSKITVSGEEKLLLGEITTFNIEARYDVVKTRLYRKATLAFTAKFLKATRQLFRKFRDLL